MLVLFKHGIHIVCFTLTKLSYFQQNLQFILNSKKIISYICGDDKQTYFLSSFC
jgi:hypothetical protein